MRIITSEACHNWSDFRQERQSTAGEESRRTKTLIGWNSSEIESNLSERSLESSQEDSDVKITGAMVGAPSRGDAKLAFDKYGGDARLKRLVKAKANFFLLV